VRQESYQVIEKSLSISCPERDTEDSVFAKNTYINKTNNKNTDRKGSDCNRVRAERWAPVDSTFHPRLINIAKVAEIAWKERDYRFDRALWNGAVEQIAIEMGQIAAMEFASFVKKAYYAYGRPFPYNPYLIQDFVKAFREGRSWSTVLGDGYFDPEEAKSALEGETQKSLPEAQAPLLIEAELIEQGECSKMSEVAQAPFLESQKPSSEPSASVEAENPDYSPHEPGHIESLEPWREEADVTSRTSTPEPQETCTTEKSSTHELQTTPHRSQVQITHANLIDVPLAIIRPTGTTTSVAADTVSDQPATARAQGNDLDTASEKNSAPRSPSTAVHTFGGNTPAPRSERRIELDTAALLLTAGLKCQASFQRGWAKLSDDQLYANLLHMFGAQRVHKLIGG
jgi:hypothetical protein